MISESVYRGAFLFLLAALISMRIYFMVKVRRSGGRLTPDEQAVKREGRGVFLTRVIGFFGLMTFLIMYLLGVEWIDTFLFPLPAWLRWTGFVIGIASVTFWIWTQIHLDTQWSAQLQLTQEHHLITSGPYTHIRHPLYTAMFGWAIALSLLTANWIFVAICLLSIIGTVVRIPKEERMMIDAFGDEYEEYMKRTGWFFPRL